MKLDLNKDIINNRFSGEDFFMGEIRDSFSSFIFIGLITFVETKHNKKFDWENIRESGIDFNFEINGMEISFHDLIEYLVDVFSRTKEEKDKYIKNQAIKLLSEKFQTLYNLSDQIESIIRTELNFWERE